ncbi:MAG: histidinol phosphate phosphatase [Planctomycetes bacterium]|nr:histidinol phosphate phosphatase [Planctomycetota bacterium]
MPDNLKHRLDVASAAALEAGKATLRHFQTALAVELKGDRTPVTAADREAEEVLFSILTREFPGDAFLGEERGERPGTTGFRWVVDPIDGTKSFIQGVPLYGVMVGLEDPLGDAVAGVVCLPALGEVVAGARGEGTTWNGRKARVSAVGALADSCLVYTSHKTFEDAGRDEAYERARKLVRVARGWGDCFGHVLVATGRAEVMLDPILNDWDCAALLPILEGSGGTFTDWHGRRTVCGKSGISTNGKVQAELMACLASAR